MVTCEKVQKYPVGFTIEFLPLCKNSATDGMVVIGESLGDSIQRVMGRVGRAQGGGLL